MTDSRFGAVENISPLCIRPRLHRLGADRAKRTIAKNSNETEMLLSSRCRRFNDRDGPSRLLTEPGRRPMATRAVCSPLVAGCQTRNRAVTGVPRDSVLKKNRYGLKALGAWGTAKRILN